MIFFYTIWSSLHTSKPYNKTLYIKKNFVYSRMLMLDGVLWAEAWVVGCWWVRAWVCSQPSYTGPELAAGACAFKHISRGWAASVSQPRHSSEQRFENLHITHTHVRLTLKLCVEEIIY